MGNTVSAQELFVKASNLQFKEGRPAEAYYYYGLILNNFPNFEHISQVKMMRAQLEKQGISANDHLEERKAILEEQKAILEEREAIKEKQRELGAMLISSGFSFEGYRIVRYSGYISGDDAIEIPRSGLFGKGQNGERLTDALVKIRRQALIELKEAAYDLGCNAVVGVDFDYITLEPQTATLGTTIYEPYVICVTANGNAVEIEKI